MASMASKNVVQNPTWATRMFKASIAPRLIAGGEPNDQTSRVLGAEEETLLPAALLWPLSVRERPPPLPAGRTRQRAIATKKLGRQTQLEQVCLQCRAIGSRRPAPATTLRALVAA